MSDKEQIEQSELDAKQDKSLNPLSGVQDTNPPELNSNSENASCVTFVYRRNPPCEHQEDVEVPDQQINICHTEPLSGQTGETSPILSEKGNPVVEGDPNDVRPVSTSSSTDISSYLELGSSYGSSHLSSFQEKHCGACRLLMQDFCCDDTKEFWRDTDCEGPDPHQSCHIKYFGKFLERLKDRFPQEEGLKSTNTINLLKQLLKVNLTDKTATLRLADLNRIIVLFGPIKEQNNRCVLIKQLYDVIKKSLKSRERDKKIKSSWFVGEMSREDAEDSLLDKDHKDKTYLVRISGTDGDDGDFVLSVRHDDHCHHLKIKGDPKRALTEASYHAHLTFAGKEFQSLPDVVDYVTKNNDITIEQDTNADCDDNACTSVTCLRVFLKSPLNGVMSGYEKAKR